MDIEKEAKSAVSDLLLEGPEWQAIAEYYEDEPEEVWTEIHNRARQICRDLEATL